VSWILLHPSLFLLFQRDVGKGKRIYAPGLNTTQYVSYCHPFIFPNGTAKLPEENALMVAFLFELFMHPHHILI
jgi:hypothetical protein